MRSSLQPLGEQAKVLAQEEIIRNCYVTTRLSDQADKTLNQLLQDIPSSLLKQAGVEDTGVTKSDVFAHQFERDIERYRPGPYILTEQSAARRASHITGLRVLARLTHSGDASSQHGEGFVRTAILLKEYRNSFGYAEDFEEVVGEFTRRGLIESEPPRATEASQSSALRISASGSYYWRYLVRAFAYVDLVYVDTAISHRAVARRLADYATGTEMTTRFERVRLFLKYLRDKEQEELEEVAKRSGPYRQALIPEVATQIEREMRQIAGKI